MNFDTAYEIALECKPMLGWFVFPEDRLTQVDSEYVFIVRNKYLSVQLTINDSGITYRLKLNNWNTKSHFEDINDPDCFKKVRETIKSWMPKD